MSQESYIPRCLKQKNNKDGTSTKIKATPLKTLKV